ncbi:MAG: alpha-amylase family glycosyl hydrolase, partial [Bacteroidota bacterium]
LTPEPDEAPACAPASSQFTFSGGSIYFEEDAGGLVETYEWIFEGGEPSTFTGKEVSVSYGEPGIYNVSLTVTNDFSSDELFLEGFITVEEQSTDELAWWNESVFYEIFVRSFYDSDGDGIGDFQGIIEKLDYLNDGDPTTTTDLGITGIWLMPIHDSPSYHGYDVNDYRSINPDYGTMDDFKEFLAAAHERGIKVIIDLVLNHSSTEIEWFKEARSSVNSDKRNWYRWSDTRPSYSGPWGQPVWHQSSNGYYYGLFWGGMPDLNYEEPTLKEEMYDVTRFWLEDIGIDGYRLDAVKYIIEEDDDLEDISATHEFWREWVAVTKESNPEALSVGEAWTSTEKIVPYVVNNGIDFCFDFDLGGAMLNAVRSGNASSLERQINEVINSYPYYQFGTFTTNHDMNRLMNELSSDEELVKLVSSIYLTLPGVPFIYYGEEVGMLGSKPDENIRRPMSWNAEGDAGFTIGNPWNAPALNYQSNNVEDQLNDRSSILNWYRRLVQLRGSSASLQTGDHIPLGVGTDGVLAFKRISDEDMTIVLANISNQVQSVTIDVSDITVSDGEGLVDYMGSERIELSGLNEITIELEPKKAKILIPGDLTLNTEDETKIEVYPNPTSELLIIRYKGSFDYQLISLEGKEMLKGSSQDSNEIDISLVPEGVYLLKIGMLDSAVVRKIVVK